MHRDIALYIISRTILCCHFLNIIGTSSQHLVSVNPNQICLPATVMTVLEQRGIRSHCHQVTVAFHPTDKSGFGQSTKHITRTDTTIASVFTYINLVFTALITIKQSSVTEEKIRVNIPVRVYHISFRYL